MSQIFQFGEYTVRPAEESDRVYIETLIAADIYHCNRMDADYFLKPLPGETSWAMEGKQGKVLFYFKTSPIVRVSIQFTGNETMEERAENRLALIQGLAWMEAALSAARFREIVFDTEGPELTIFAKRHMGFVEERSLMVRPIPILQTPNVQPDALGNVPTSTAGREG